MKSAMINRENYIPEAVYFIPADGTDWRVESMSPDYTVRLSSEVDSVATLQAFLDAHAVLAVNSTKNEIQADGVDSTVITLVNGGGFSYRVLQGNIPVAAGGVGDGVLELQVGVAAEYFIELKTPDDKTGYVKVVAHD